MAISLVVLFIAIAAFGAFVAGHRATLATPRTPAANGAAHSPSPFPRLSPSPSPSPPPVSGPFNPQAIAAAVNPAVVDIIANLGRQGSAAGTGMVISPSGEVLTNNHVIAGALSISVEIAGTTRRFRATVVGTDVRNDVAVLQMQGASGLPTIPVGDSSQVAVGDRVLALGNALGLAGPPSKAPGVVVALQQSITASDPSAGTSESLAGLIQTDAHLQPGDSGGPLANAGGEVIGMDTAASTRVRANPSVGGGGFAIPINSALAIAARLYAGQGAAGAPGFLGIQVGTVYAQDGSSVGAGVAGLVSGGPAEAAGIHTGDVIVGFDGKAVYSGDALTTDLQAHQVGDAIRLQWVDSGGQSHSATVRLAASPGG